MKPHIVFASIVVVACGSSEPAPKTQTSTAAAAPSENGAPSPSASDTATSGGFGGGGGRSHAVDPSKLSVTAGTVAVTGKLPEDVITRIVQQDFGSMKLCYQTALDKTPGLAGKVRVKFTIDHSGGVSKVESPTGDLTNADVVACVSQKFSAMKFPAPSTGTVTVVFPVVFAAN